MQRAHSIKPAGAWNTAEAVDRVSLDADARARRRIVLEGEQGTAFLLDLPQVPALRDGDGLVLDDGRIVQVIGRKEPLTEIEAATGADRLRLAWHLGNRHTEVEIVGERLRIRRDHVLEAMLADLGARLAHIEAPFQPERGAYAHAHPSDAPMQAASHAHDHG